MMVMRWARLATGSVAALLVAASADAQIRTDSSLGRAGQSLAGPQFTIPETLGALRGANLFHSFSVFNVGRGESATFTTSTPGIANVVSRVTGGEPSMINGLVRLAPAEGAPAFFFINPSGVTFGAGASLDVPGAIHISTADYVKFPDGSFHADATTASTLSSAPPEAFGFLGSHRGAVEVNGGARLTAALMQPFSITAGDITIDNGRAAATGGDIRIVALGTTRAEIPLVGELPAAFGSLRIVNGGTLSTPAGQTVDAGRLSVSSGDILIDRGGSVQVTGLTSQANTGTTGNAGTIDVRATGSLQVVRGGVISSSTFATGDAGSITVNAGSVTIDGADAPNITGILSQADSGSSGRAGTVSVSAAGRVDILDGLISSSTFGSGNAGEVRLSGGTIALEARSRARAPGVVSNASAGTGNAGAVFVATPGTLTITNGATISSGTSTSGNAGAVDVRARDILMDGGGYGDLVTSIVSNARAGSTGHAGTVNVSATGLVSLLSGAEISSSAFASGDAGKVTVSAERIVLDGRGFTTFGTGIYSSAATGSTGNAGSIDIDVRELTLRDASEVASNTFGRGNAGRVSVRATDIRVEGGEYGYAAIVSSAQRGSQGNAGSVDISASGQVTLVAGGEIASSTFSQGDAGTVHVAARNITIDGRGGRDTTGILSQANAGAGNAGNVFVDVAEALSIYDHGLISSGTFDSGNAGSVVVNAGRITIDATRGGVYATGIVSGADVGSTGHAGSVIVTTPGLLEIHEAGEISSSTFSSGNGGTVTVRAGAMTIDARGNYAGVFSSANEGSTGNAGSIDVAVAGRLSLTDQGKISSTTFGTGDAGNVRVSAGELAIDGGQLAYSYTGIASNADRPGTGNAGRVEVNVAGALTIAAGGAITSSTFTSGNASSVTVQARSLTIDGKGECPPCTGIASQAEAGSTGRAGQVDVTVMEDLVIRDLGFITTGTNNAQDAGQIRVHARNILIEGVGGFDDSDFTGILSNAISGSGSAGVVDVTAAEGIVLRAGGSIGSSTYSAGNAGTVNVTAGTIYMERYPSGISTTAYSGSSGNAGTVTVNARAVEIVNGGEISSSTFGDGDAGRVRVVTETLLIDRAGALRGTGISSHAEDGIGNGGSIEIVADHVAVMAGGSISSTTYGDGNAGSVSVRARTVVVDGGEDNWPSGITSETAVFGSGRAGSVDIAATGDILVARGGYISSSSQSYGPAGSVSLSAPSITLVGGPFSEFHDTGVESRAGFYASAAGTVNITADRLQVLNGAVVTASTSSFSGEAGSVFVNAGDVVVDGERSSINARAENYSRGQSGSVSVDATRSILVSNGAEIAITNLMSLGGPYPWDITPTLLSVTAPIIELRDGGTISAASLGDIPASNIAVRVGERMLLDNASITTSAVDGNGGSITVSGDGVVVLRNSRITTSVSGLIGNGGDIRIATRGLVMDTGFIQANTAALDAAGGNVSIDVDFLIPSGSSLLVGGSEPLEFRTGIFGLNVIQAAAPTGVSGAIDITTPALDVSAGLTGLTAKVLDGGGLGRSLCDVSGGSSLALAGRGSMPLSARDFLRAQHTEPPKVAGLAPVGMALARITCSR